MRKSKQEIKKELEDFLINEEKHENKDIEEKAGKVQNCQHAAALIQKFEGIIKSLKKMLFD